MSEPPFPPPNQPPPNQPPPNPPPSYQPPSYPATYVPPPFPPPPRRRRVLPVVLASIAAVVVLAGAVLVPWLLTREDDDDRGADRQRDDSPSDLAASEEVDTSNLDAVESFDDLDTTHLRDGESIDYPQSPPVGGRHASRWLECGVYDEVLPDIHVVHDLEHGTVWITYRDDAVDEAGITKLGDQLPGNGILSPYPDQDAPVVVTVWGRQLALTGPDDPRLALFIAEYGAGETAPEPFASCHGGIDPADVDGGGRVA